MKIPRDLSGRAVAQALVQSLEYPIVHERGSHIDLETETPRHQRIVIPDHKSLRIGMLNAIIVYRSPEKPREGPDHQAHSYILMICQAGSVGRTRDL